MRSLRYALIWVSLGLASAQTIVTYAGLPYSHRASLDGKVAISARLGNVYGLLIDKTTGRLLIHDEVMVSRLEPDGTLLTLVGMGRGSDGRTTDGTLASGFNAGAFRGMAEDSAGRLYLADAYLGRVFRVDLNGAVTTFAGGGEIRPGVPDDGLPATQAGFSSPRGLVFDSQGNLDIADVYCRCIRRVSPGGTISTVFTLPQNPFQYFEGLAIDSQDNLYAAEWQGSAVWKIAADGTAAIVAGTGVPGFSGDGGAAAAAQLNRPSGVTVAPDGGLYIADTGNHRIRRIAPDGTISTIAGTGVPGYAGDGGPAVNARLQAPAQTLLDGSGNLYIADYNNRRVRSIAPDGTITTLMGSGVLDQAPLAGQVGDGGSALNAIFNVANSVAFGPAGELYVADMLNNRVRKITPDGIVTTIAGNGQTGYAGEGGPAAQATITRPITVVADQSGTVYFVTGDSRVLKVTPDGILHLVAGTGTGTGLNRAGGDNGPAVKATLNEPKGLAVDDAGNVYIGDTTNARLRKVDANGIITTIATPGVIAQDYWNAVTLDPQGVPLVGITHTDAGQFYSVVDRVNADGTRARVAGNGQSCSNLPPTGFSWDGMQASQVPLCLVLGLSFDAQGFLYIPESFYGAILRVSPDGTIRRIAGSVLNRDLGDGGSPLLASFQGGLYYVPSSVAVDRAGNIFIPQAGANRIREIIPEISVRFSRARVDFQGASAQSQSIQVAATVAEPMPFSTVVKNSGPPWLSVNRVTGQTGDMLLLSANPAGLAKGTYTATVEVTLSVTPVVTASLPVTLTVP